MVIVNFPIKMIEIAATFNENVNEDYMDLTNMLIQGEIWRDLQSTLKVALKKVSSQDFNKRLGATDFKKKFIFKLRKQ